MNERSERGGLQELAASLAGWRNRTDTCGAYAAAVMLAGLQDSGMTELIPAGIRRPGETDGEKLIAALTECMNGARKTLPFNVSLGINRFIRKYAAEPVRGSLKAHWRFVPARGLIKRELDAGRFCCLGIVRYRGSRYGNHWVTAYGYRKTPHGIIYLAHDNWGNAQAEIPGKWVNSIVYMK